MPITVILAKNFYRRGMVGVAGSVLQVWADRRLTSTQVHTTYNTDLAQEVCLLYFPVPN